MKNSTNKLIKFPTANVAILDEHGRIVAVNEQWKRFAQENGGDDITFYIGANYLSICEDAIRRKEEDSDIAEAVLLGLHGLLHGELEDFAVEYPCNSPDEKRWFTAHLIPFWLNDAAYILTWHENITSRKQIEDEHFIAEATLNQVMETLPLGVWILDKQGNIVHGNPAGQKIWAGARFVGPEQFGEYKGWWLSTGQPIAANEWAAARAVQKGETSIDEEIIIECFDGSRKIILNSAIPMRDEEGNISGAIIVNQDITSRKHAEEKLVQAYAAIETMNQELQKVLAREQHRARTDELTGLNNRRYFYEMSEQLFIMSKRYRTRFSILIFDIDNFKRINDTFGHQIGDNVLKYVAKMAREHTRHSDVLARYGGEEFIMALPNTGIQGALRLAENIRKKVADYRDDIGNKELKTTISIGIAEVLPTDKTLDILIQHADKALYEAKTSGRNCSRMYSGAKDQATE